MTVQSRMQALLELVERDRSEHCAASLGQARAQADALLASARGQARRLVAHAFADERERARAALDAARARLQTQRRALAQKTLQRQLALAWQALPGALHARWHDPAARAQWVAHAGDSARALLGACEWTVQHGANWSETERGTFAQELAAALGSPPRFEHDEAIAAGLRIVAGANRLDFTVAGLLADRDEIGGRLIALLEAQGAQEP